MKLKKVGFFRELEYCGKDEGTLREAINDHPEENEDKIINYLNDGVVFCVCPGLVFDVLDESKGIIGSLELLTDGEWVWASDLSYYVANYHVRLDEKFMEHIKENGWMIQDREKIDLSKIDTSSF